MKIQQLVEAMERIAPTHLAEEWDNVGLILGLRNDELRGPVLLTIDLTEAVVDEAIQLKAGAIVAYHPPIFQPVRRLVDGSHGLLFRAARAGIAVYTPHTSLDACAGGLTDWLAEGIRGVPSDQSNPAQPPGRSGSGGDVRALRPALLTGGQDFKIVTFVPREHLDNVRSALASAGAGFIGDYELCSFNTPGEGTFRGRAGTKPAVGTAENFEQVAELRLEMVCPKRALALALTTLRQFHPYEEPAIDVYPLAPRPDRAQGAGRRVMLDHPCTIRELAERLKRHLGIQAVHAAGSLDADIECVGIVAGAGASLADEAAVDGCQVFVTGEMKHHEVNALLARGVSVILAGHTATERGYLPILARRLEAEGGIPHCLVSRADGDPLVLV